MHNMSNRLTAVVAASTLLIGGSALAANNAGPEPYKAADPQYAQPMMQEPHIAQPAADKISLGSAENIKGPAAGPEPYSAPTPHYASATGEPKIKLTKGSLPKP